MPNRIIGNAWVRIRALTDTLDKEIRDAFKGSDFDKLGKDLGDEISKGIAEGIDAGLKDVKKDIDDKLNELGDGSSSNIEVKVDLDNNHFTEKWNELLRQVNDYETSRLKIDPELDRTALNNVKRQIELQLSAQTLQIDPDVSRHALERIQEKFDDLREEIESKEVEVKPSIHAVAMKWVQARLAALTRNRTVQIITQIDSASYGKVVAALAALSGLRALQDIFDRLKDFFKDLDKNIPKLAIIIEAVGLIAATALTASSNILAFVASLAEVAFTGLLLPGILGGFAFGIGTMIAALKDASFYLDSVKKEFSRLQDIISVNFWAIATTPIKDLVHTLIPELEVGLQRTSRSLGRFVAALSDSFASHLGSGRMTAMFDNLATSIDITATYADDFGRILEHLGTVGSEYLPRFATWFGDISRTFGDWLEKNRKTGQLTEWMELGIQRTNELGRVIRYTGSIIYNMGKIAEEAGGSSLTSLANTLERVANVVKGEPFRSNMVKVFESAHNAMTLAAREGGQAFKDMMAGLVPVLQEGLPLVGQAVGELLEGISTAINTPGFKNGFTDLLTGIRDGIRELEPMWEPLGEGLGAVGTLIGNLTSNFGPLIAEMFIILSNVVVELTPLIVALSDALSGALLAALQIVGPILEALAITLSQLSPVVIAAATAFGVLAAATKVLDLATAARTTTMFSNMGAALGLIPAPALAVAAGLAAVYGIIQVVTNAGVMEKSAQDFQKLIESLDGSIESIESVNDGFGRMDEAARMARGEIEAAASDAYGFSSSYETMANVSDHSAASIQSLGDAMRLTAQGSMATFTDRLFALGDGFHLFGVHSAALNQSKEDMEAFDEAASAVVTNGNLEQIAELEAYVTEQMKESGESRAVIMDQLPQYRDALEAHNAAQERIAETATEAAMEMIYFQEALSNFGTVTPEVMHMINEGSKAFMSFSDAISEATGDAGFSLQNFMQILRDQATAQDEWANNMALIAERASSGLLQELSRLGPEAAPLVADLVTASDEELAELEALFLRTGEGAASNLNSEFGKMNQQMMDQLNGLNLTAIDSSGKLEETFRSLGYDVKDGMLTGMREIPGGMSGILGGIDLNTLPGGSELIKVFTELGYEVTNGFITGLGTSEGVGTAAQAAVEPAIVAAKSILQVQSPSKVFEGIGKNVVEGFNIGLTSDPESTTTAGTSVMTTLLNVFSGALSFLNPSGRNLGQGLRDGFSSTDVTTPGSRKFSELNTALTTQTLTSTGLAQGQTFVGGFTSVDASSPGAYAVRELADGITRNMGRVSGAGTSTGNAFKNAAGAVDSYASGQSITSRFASGITSLVGWVSDAARKIATAARNMLPQSPAKEGPFSGSGWGGWGESIGRELADGLLAQRQLVANASHALMDSVDMSSDPVNIAGPVSESYNTNRAVATMPNAHASAQGSGDTYEISVTVAVEDIEGIKKAQEFAEHAKLWAMMG